ncbi:hypothetical protein M0Q39_00140 [Patescibacteria group bacterium]|nr:hypothetical protein [Patescibacteria group bacterium]
MDNKLNRKFIVWGVLMGAFFGFLINILANFFYDVFIIEIYSFEKVNLTNILVCCFSLVALIGYLWFFVYDYPNSPELTKDYLKRFWDYFTKTFWLGRILAVFFALCILIASISLLAVTFMSLSRILGYLSASIVFIIIFGLTWFKKLKNK